MMGGTTRSWRYGPGGGTLGGQGMMGGSGAQQASAIASLDAAKQPFQAYVDRTGNQDLALDEVMQQLKDQDQQPMSTDPGTGTSLVNSPSSSPA